MDNDRVNNLIGVKIGDVYMCYGTGWHPRLERIVCEKITPKQATIGGVKYWIENARKVGRDSYSRRGSLQHWDAAAFRQDQKELRLENIRYKLSDMKWKTISDETVSKVWDIIKQEIQPKGSDQ